MCERKCNIFTQAVRHNRCPMELIGEISTFNQRRSQDFCLGGAPGRCHQLEFCVISRSRPDSVGGGGTSRNFPWSPKAHHVRWGGGGGGG